MSDQPQNISQLVEKFASLSRADQKAVRRQLSGGQRKLLKKRLKALKTKDALKPPRPQKKTAGRLEPVISQWLSRHIEGIIGEESTRTAELVTDATRLVLLELAGNGPFGEIRRTAPIERAAMSELPQEKVIVQSSIGGLR